MSNFDKSTQSRLAELQKSFRNAIPLFGGACWATSTIANGDFEGFCWYLPGIVKSAKFWGWSGSIESALVTFCDLCLVDPKLVELYLGMTFAEFVIVAK